MRTVPEDLAASARIRRAAIRLFGEYGFDIGLRAIADEAGVSLGLIRHHFGSKDGLRDACDIQVLDDLGRAQAEQAAGGTQSRGLLEQLAGMDVYRPLVQYVLQALRAGGPQANAFWQRMLADAQAYLEQGVANGVVKPSLDEAARARFLTLVEMGALMLEAAIAPPEEDFADTWRRYLDAMALPGLEVYTQGLLTDSSLLDTYLEHKKEQS